MVRELAGTVYRRFFMKIEDTSADKMLLNKTFVDECFNIREGSVFLMTDDADAWQFRIIVEEGCVYLSEGWAGFCGAYNLEKDDQVLCSYDMDRTFITRLFKKNGMEEDVSDAAMGLDVGGEQNGLASEDDMDDESEPDESEPEESEPDEDSEECECWSIDGCLALTPDRIIEFLDVEEEKLNGSQADVVEEVIVAAVVKESGVGENMMPGEGSPVNTPAATTGEPSSARGSVTSKKRAAADRFKGLVIGERLNFLGAIEAEREVVEGVNQMNEDIVHVSSGTVATNLGQMVGEHSYKRRKDKGNNEQFQAGAENNGGFEVGTNECLVIHCAQAQHRFVGYCAVKMTAPILRRKYRVPLELPFARSNLGRGQNDVVVRRADGLVWAIGCFLGMKRARINTGWRKFANENDLKVGDLVVMVHGNDGKVTWDVVIFRNGA